MDLLQPVDESCVSTRVTTTTNAPPPDYCNTIVISGSENHYGAAGTYQKTGHIMNGKPTVSTIVYIVVITIIYSIVYTRVYTLGCMDRIQVLKFLVDDGLMDNRIQWCWSIRLGLC